MLEVTAYAGIGPGVKQVAVTNLEVRAAKAGGDYLRWEFTDRDGKTGSANSSVEMTPGNKTGKWFAALTGRPTVVGEKRSLSEVIGKWCTIVVELNPEGYPKVIALTEPEGSAPKSPVKPLDESAPPPTPLGVVTDELPF